MKKFIRQLFRRTDPSPSFQPFSTTMTDAAQGMKAQHHFNPEISKLVHKLKDHKEINNVELNKIIDFYFNIPPIPQAYYKINPLLQEGMVFTIDSVNTVTNEVDDISNVMLTLREITYNIDFSIKISVEDFHEILKTL